MLMKALNPRQLHRMITHADIILKKKKKKNKFESPAQQKKNLHSPKLSSFLKPYPAVEPWTGFKAPGQWNDGVM